MLITFWWNQTVTLSADTPEEEVITRDIPAAVIERQHPEVTGGAPQLVTRAVDETKVGAAAYILSWIKGSQ